MSKIADFVKSTSLSRGDFKLALITDQQKTNSAAALYVALSKDGHGKLCLNMEEAKTWVVG